VTHSTQSRACGSQLTSTPRFGAHAYAGCLLAMLWCGGVAVAQETVSGETRSSATPSGDTQPGTQPGDTQSPEEISVFTQRQTQLNSEALSISDTPDAEPHVNGISGVAGLGALVGPAYDGSKKTKTSPYPYVDIHGFFNDHMYLSSVRGIGVNLLDLDHFRGGFALNYAAGRTSKDDPHLNGLPDISGAAQVGGFLTYSLKPVAFEARVRRRLGSTAGTQVELGASVGAAPVPRLHLSLGVSAAWADASYQKTFFGVTPAEATQATALGNPLTPYTPKAGLTTAGVTAAGVYQMGKHWGLIGRLELQDLVGKQAKDSPLTQRDFQPAVAFGAAYTF
jgi:MipA family protein